MRTGDAASFSDDCSTVSNRISLLQVRDEFLRVGGGDICVVFIDSDAVIQGDIEELSRISVRTGDAASFSDDCSTVSNRISLLQVREEFLRVGGGDICLVFIDSDAVIQGDIEELSRISMRTGDAASFSDDCSTVSNRISLLQVREEFLRVGVGGDICVVFIDSDAVIQGDIEEMSRISMRTGDAASFSDDCSTVSNRISLLQVREEFLRVGGVIYVLCS